MALMLVDLFVAVMKATVSVAVMQLEVSATLMQVKIFAANMWVTILLKLCRWSLLQSCRWYFLQCIMHMTISIVIMQVAVSIVAMYVTASSSKFIFLSLTSIFHKTDQKNERHYIKFAFHYFHKYSSRIKKLCGQNSYTNRLKESFSTFVFPIGL